MKKLLLSGLIFVAAAFMTFAGDAAAFVDLGFSSDGKTYVFAEYGKTDHNFQGYAEIYTVDVAKNDFIDGGVFRTLPSSATTSKNGKKVYEELYSKASWYLKRYNLQKADADNLLYVRDDTKTGDSEIVFKDFETSTSDRSIYYHIKLEKNVVGTGSDLKSSFFIGVEKQDENGHVIASNIVGSPDIKRKLVVDYVIDRIFSDKSGRNLVFVVEKKLADSSGTSIRYMVETIHL